MADPFSVAGTSVGVVSLGLTVCHGLIKYFSQWKSRGSDVQAAINQLEALVQTLEVLQTRLAQLPKSQQATIINVESKITSCGNGIQKLSEYLQKCHTFETQAKWKDKLRAQKQHFFYPFRRDTLQDLKQTLRDLQQDLARALETLHLDLGIEQLSQLSSVITAVSGIAIETSQMTHALNVSRQENQLMEHNIISALENQGRQIARLVIDVHQAQSGQVEELRNLRRETAETQHYLISNPGLLRTTCDELKQYQSGFNLPIEEVERDSSSQPLPGRTLAQTRLLCSCRPCRRRHMSSRRWSRNLTFFSSRDTTYAHEKGCSFHLVPQRKTTLGFRFSYCGYLLARAVQASISIPTGAGGLSISSNLTFRAVVPNDAPAFAVIRSIYEERRRGANCASLMEQAVRRILELFRNGKASPTDTNEDGQTLMHSASTIWRESCTSSEVLSYRLLIHTLINLGVPLNEPDGEDIWPLDRFLMGNMGTPHMAFIPYEQVMSFFSELVDLGGEIYLNWSFHSGADIIWFSREIEAVREALDCGALSIAVLLNAKDDVQHILLHHPSTVLEKNAWGQTALHIASGWPEGLKLLLQTDSPPINVGDGWDDPPFVYACRLRCEEALELLLLADCALFLGDDCGPYPPLYHALELCSERQEDMIVQELAARRRRLLALAPVPLLSSAGIFSPSDGVIDENASTLASALAESGISIEASLQIPSSRTTVYHLYWMNIYGWKSGFTPIAEKFFSAGFRDIDGYNHAGLTPLMMSLSRFDWKWGGLQYAQWLISKGANLKRKPASIAPVTVSQSATAMHYLAGHLGIRFGAITLKLNKPFFSRVDDASLVLPKLNSFDSIFRQIFADVMVDPIFDGCVCACSSGGCSSTSGFLKGFEYQSYCYINTRAGSAVATLIMDIASNVGLPDKVQARLAHQLIQNSTFERFGLKHTCCYMDFVSAQRECFNVFKVREQEEIDEIHDEQAPLVERFQALVKDLHDLFDELAIPFTQFLKEHWESRMREEEALDETASLDEEEVRKVEELGVVLKRRGPLKSKAVMEELEDSESEDRGSEDGASEDGQSKDEEPENGQTDDMETNNEAGKEDEQSHLPTPSETVYTTGAASRTPLRSRANKGRSNSI